MNRRGFLRLAGAAVGGVALARYAEPLLAISDPGAWIEDKGDFLIIRIPEKKSFANETLTKPALVIMGLNSVMRDVSSKFVLNIDGKGFNTVSGLHLDVRGMATASPRSVVQMRGDHLALIGALVNCGDNFDSAFHVMESEHVRIEGCHVWGQQRHEPSGYLVNCRGGVA